MKRLSLLLLLILAVLPVQAQDATWYSWLYVEGRQELVLVDSSGSQQVFPVPAAPELNPDEVKYFGFAPDGSQMVMVTYALDGRPAVVFTNLQTRESTIWFGEPGEDIFPTANGTFILPPTLFNIENALFSFGVSNPETGAWRVILFDYTAGRPAAALNSTEAPNLPEGTPIIQLLGEDALHVQLLTFSPPPYPAFAWTFAGEITESPYIHTFGDIHPVTQEYIFPGIDDATNLIPPSGPTPPYNAIFSDTQSPEVIYATGDNLIGLVRWAEGTNAVVFQTPLVDDFGFTWNVLALNEDNEPIMLDGAVDAIGTPDGVLTIEESGSGAPGSQPVISLVYYPDPSSPQILIDNLNTEAPVFLLWSSFEGVEYNGPRP
jgi:hypothetical protein